MKPYFIASICGDNVFSLDPQEVFDSSEHNIWLSSDVVYNTRKNISWVLGVGILPERCHKNNFYFTIYKNNTHQIIVAIDTRRKGVSINWKYITRNTDTKKNFISKLVGIL